MANKDDLTLMEETLTEINWVISYIKGYSYEQFVSDQKTIDAVVLRLEQIAEKIEMISPVFKENHNEIPWGEIIGFRNGLVHEYGSTDFSTVYEVATQDIYQLKELFESLL